MHVVQLQGLTQLGIHQHIARSDDAISVEHPKLAEAAREGLIAQNMTVNGIENAETLTIPLGADDVANDAHPDSAEIKPAENFIGEGGEGKGGGG